jgi:autotransporter translocation and assembly factor TamB
MQRRSVAIAAGLAALLAVAAWTGDISGTWTGQLSGPDGNSFNLTYSFKQDGEKLTGTVAGPQGDPIQLEEGKVQGDKISFTVHVEFNGGTKFTSEGTIKGEEITITTKAEGGEALGGPMTLKKQK